MKLNQPNLFIKQFIWKILRPKNLRSENTKVSLYIPLDQMSSHLNMKNMQDSIEHNLLIYKLKYNREDVFI